MSKNNFNFQYVIGRGGFGKVSLIKQDSFFITSIVHFTSKIIFTAAGMACRVPQDIANICDERDVEGADNIETQCDISHE